MTEIQVIERLNLILENANIEFKKSMEQIKKEFPEINLKYHLFNHQKEGVCIRYTSEFSEILDSIKNNEIAIKFD